MSETNDEKRAPLTKKEVEAKKAEMTKWHTDQIPFLETQLKYETLLTGVQQAITSRAEAEYKWLQIKSALMEKDPTDINGNTPQTPPVPTAHPPATSEAPGPTLHRTLKTE